MLFCDTWVGRKFSTLWLFTHSKRFNYLSTLKDPPLGSEMARVSYSGAVAERITIKFCMKHYLHMFTDDDPLIGLMGWTGLLTNDSLYRTGFSRGQEDLRCLEDGIPPSTTENMVERASCRDRWFLRSLILDRSVAHRKNLPFVLTPYFLPLFVFIRVSPGKYCCKGCDEEWSAVTASEGPGKR